MKTFLMAFALAGLLSGTAAGQCQLAVNEAPEPVDIATLVDTALFDGIDPLTEIPADFPQCDLQLLRGYAYSLFATGEHELQARVYTYILRHERNFIDMYNLACCFSRMGMADKTLEYLGYAFDYGYMDIEWVEQDTDMDLVRETPRYLELVALQRERLAEQEESRAATIVIECPVNLPCNLVLPDGFDPSTGHLLVIGLHGAGDNAERFGTLPGYFGENDFIYVAPQAPITVAEGGYVWFGESVDRAAGDRLVEYLENVVEAVRSSYRIDGIYLVGFSQGAALSYLAGISRPDLIDGVVAFGGWLDPQWFSPDELAAASDLDVFIAHGSDDNVELAQQSFQILSEAGYDVDYNEFPGGHFIHLDTLHEAVDWIRD